MTVNRQLAAIMFTDIVGYTALMGEDEGKAFAILSKNRTVQRPLIEQHNGRWIKELGDGVLASFSAVTDAVLCAQAIQQACKEHNDYRLRIGIHQGEVVFENGDVFGDGVNIASRIQAVAPEGGIWMSEAAYQNIANKKEFQVRPLHQEVLKNVKEPVRIYEVVSKDQPLVAYTNPITPAASGKKPLSTFYNKRYFILVASTVLLLVLAIGLWNWMTDQKQTEPIRSIAVLPFINETKNKDLEFLSDGMTETLISSLSQLPDLNVKARSSVFRYKGKESDLQSIRKDLNVQAVLNGRVVQHGDVWTIYLELVNVLNNNQIWGEQYNRKTADLVLLQSEIAQDVSDKLRLKLSGADKQKLTKRSTTNPEAYQLYLKGRFYWNKRTPEDNKKAIDYFQQAITLDSSYALAYTGLADTYSRYLDYQRGYVYDTLAKAKTFALKALALDNQLAEAHTSFGMFLYNDYDLAGSERALKRAIELNPNYATAHLWYGNLLVAQAKIEEALTEYRQALALEPLSPVMSNAYAGGLFIARRYDECIAQAKKTLEIDPNNIFAYEALASAYGGKEDHVHGTEYYAKSRELSGDAQGAARVRADFAKGGFQGYLRGRLKDPRFMTVPVAMARVYVYLGNKDSALAQLNKAYKLRVPQLLRINTDPRFDSLRDDPRFQELVRRIGLQ